LQKNASISPTNGNLELTANALAWRTVGSTIFVSSGKWYIELTSIVIGDGAFGLYSAADAASGVIFGSNNLVGETSTSYAYLTHTGQKYTNASGSAYGSSLAANDVLGLAFDADAGTVTYYKNGTSLGQAFSGLSGAYAVAVAVETGGAGTTQIALNFGQRAFAYTAPSGFQALVTTNLPTPTIGATSTTQANDYFNPVLYTGNGTSSRSITGVGFAPDFVWVKNRSGANSHGLYDTIRGATKSLYSNSTSAEQTDVNSLTAFGSDGFTVGTDGIVNTNTSSYVSWNWNAGGSNATNTAGTITSTVRANTTSGFSIVTYTGNGTTGATVGHGLGVTPDMIIVKKRSTGTDGNWIVYHTSTGINQYLYLNSTAAAATSSPTWGVSSTLITLQQPFNDYNTSTAPYVAYCFDAVAGYSAFGSYTGNGSGGAAGTGDGPFVYTGFRPRWIMVKVISGTTANWSIIDTARSPYNFANLELWPSSSAAEQTYAIADILSNGFKLRSDSGQWNTNGAVYIYAAFAESPFKYALAR
jgi:hypothetical protein